ncbi:YadA C-terminal domain-containing protein [Vibrio nomapromontoriensis]|uniref:YadA C-terminal domain-containing protein n=1 Tax=Vibrio nomapromontoriensis TaxID=2910246 RepID=UPI003D11FB38
MKKQTIALAIITAFSSGTVMAGNIHEREVIRDGNEIVAVVDTVTDKVGNSRIVIDEGSKKTTIEADKNGKLEGSYEGAGEGKTEFQGEIVGKDRAVISEKGNDSNYAILDDQGKVLVADGDWANVGGMPEQSVKHPTNENRDNINKNRDDINKAGTELEKAEQDQQRDNQAARDAVDQQREWNKQAESAGKELANSVDKKFGQAERSISDNATAIADNKAAIDNLGEAMQKQGQEMRERYDGVKASMHAITNAKPVAYDVGEFAVGAGLGAAGSKQAVAIGGAYRFNEQWAGSFTVNHETAGRHTKADTSAGIGAQFSFK